MAKGRKKPLVGSKKWDRALLVCSVPKCENEFYVSLCETPTKRKCEEHYAASKKAPQGTEQILAMLGMA